MRRWYLGRRPLVVYEEKTQKPNHKARRTCDPSTKITKVEPNKEDKGSPLICTSKGIHLCLSAGWWGNERGRGKKKKKEKKKSGKSKKKSSQMFGWEPPHFNICDIYRNGVAEYDCVWLQKILLNPVELLRNYMHPTAYWVVINLIGLIAASAENRSSSGAISLAQSCKTTHHHAMT